MTVSTFAQIPLAAGGAIAASLSRAGLWTLSHYMRAPLANTGLLFLATFSAMAGTNALYSQTGPHPSPFFMESPAVPRPVERAEGLAVIPPVPVANAPARPQTATPPATTSTATPASTASTADAEEVVGNTEVFRVQTRLLELGLFQGKVDGYYGPMTASAIRAFETRNGMNPVGALTPSVISAILNSGSAARVQPATPAPAAATPASVPEAEVRAPEAIAAETINALVAAVETPRAPAATQTMPPPVPAASVPEASAAAAAPAANESLVMQIQRGLASLGFLHGAIDGRPGDTTARAIRNFEVYHNYRVTGEIRPELIEQLRAAGASL